MTLRLPISGSYSTNYGVIDLRSNGDAVEGTYIHQGGRVSGTLRGNRLVGTWTQSGNSCTGTFVFDFDPNANGFQGTWQEVAPPSSGTWNGVRRELPLQAKGGFPGGWNSHATGPLLAGPMMGEIGERNAHIWIQARSPSPITLHIDAADGKGSSIVQTPVWSEWLCHVFHVKDLRPGVSYKYWFDSEHGRTEARVLPRRPTPWDRATRIAFGSCFYFHTEERLTICEAIARDAPAVLAMIGDNAYYYNNDWETEHAMMLAQLRARNNNSFRRLVATVPTLGIWDDHDFGPNDANAHFAGKDRSLATFRRCWANAHWGTPRAPGIFSSVRVGPAELFLLDSRWYKDRLARTILGDKQLDWLLGALDKSTAPVKIIVSPSQVLAEASARKGWECFRCDAPDELEGLMSDIETCNIRGVIFVSGDLHMANLLHQQGRDLNGRRGPEWWELTTSPLANEPWKESIAGDDPYFVSEVIDRRNYGLVDIDLDRAGAEVKLLCKDERGDVLFEQAIALDTLAVRR